ncbi:hypothetical protein phiOC_p273 [Ochrobactrum phage vB_OspM_OC]|nr:hypothetical protein phiOC_p273 [Ochrobactrum phage vB_OspM_OC]
MELGFMLTLIIFLFVWLSIVVLVRTKILETETGRFFITDTNIYGFNRRYWTDDSDYPRTDSLIFALAFDTLEEARAHIKKTKMVEEYKPVEIWHKV